MAARRTARKKTPSRSAPTVPPEDEKRDRGRPTVYDDPWSKVTVVLTRPQIDFLDALLKDLKRKPSPKHPGKRAINRSTMIQALVESLMGSKVARAGAGKTRKVSLLARYLRDCLRAGAKALRKNGEEPDGPTTTEPTARRKPAEKPAKEKLAKGTSKLALGTPEASRRRPLVTRRKKRKAKSTDVPRTDKLREGLRGAIEEGYRAEDIARAAEVPLCDVQFYVKKHGAEDLDTPSAHTRAALTSWLNATVDEPSETSGDAEELGEEQELNF